MDLISLTEIQKEENYAWKRHFERNYQFNFLDPSYDAVPHVSRFFDEGKIAARISRMEYYLLASCPIDMGTNLHKEMIELGRGFSKDEYVWHKKHNKLGINCIGNKSVESLLVLNMQLGRKDLMARPLPSLEEYCTMPFKQKVELCRSVDQSLYSLLERMYSDYET